MGECQKESMPGRSHRYETEIGPYCTVEAKVHGNSTWLAFTDVSYGACSAIHMIDKTDDVMGHTHVAKHDLVQNLTQLIASTPKMTAPGTNCTAGKLNFSSPVQVVLPFGPLPYGQNISVKAEGHISTSGLNMTTSFDLDERGDGFRYTCESTWKFFAPPHTPPVKGV